MTGASVNFKAVKSAGHAVAHASREVAPTYLLPTDKSMGIVVVLDDAGKVSQVLDAKMALASPRAKVDQRYSPVWEGILNLRRPEPGEDAKQYRAECSAVVTDWYKLYEAFTGHKVLRVDVHLDEGHMVDGEAVLNAHAHVIADRTNDLGRVIKLSPKQLRELQTMTSEVTQLERGKSSFETGRKHISHQAYKYLAELGRLETQQQVEVEKDKTNMYGGLVDTLNSRSNEQVQKLKKATEKTENLQAKLDGEPERLRLSLIDEKYRLDREEFKRLNAEAKAAGLEKVKSQKDYSDLKKVHEKELTDLKTEAAKVPALEAKITQQAEAFDKLKAEAVEVITTLRKEAKTMTNQITQLVADKTELATEAAKAKEYQDAKAAGTPAHLIVPGEAPSPPTRGAKPGLSEGSQGVSTASLHGVAPHTPTPEEVQRVRQGSQTASEPHKTKNPYIPTPEPEKSLAEALKASMKVFFQGWVDFIKSKGFTHAALDASKGQYRGKILDTDDLFAVQKTGRDTCVIHLLSDLDTAPDIDNPDLFISYRDGVGHVTGQKPEPGRSPGMGR